MSEITHTPPTAENTLTELNADELANISGGGNIFEDIINNIINFIKSRRPEMKYITRRT